MSEPRFQLGISDPIANHITTRPRRICWNRGKNFAKFLISIMIYLYGLIQPIRGRNRVKAKKGKETIKTWLKVRFFFFKCNVLLFSMRRLLNCMALFTLVSIFEWSFSWSLDCQATKKAINISRGHGSWPFSTSIASI